MRMPEPEEDKVTTTGGGLRASGLLKLGGIRRSLLKKGLFVLQCALTESFHAVCCCACVLFLTGRLDSLAYGYGPPTPIFKQPSQHFLVYTWLTRSHSSRRGQLSTCLCTRPHCACVCLVLSNNISLSATKVTTLWLKQCFCFHNEFSRLHSLVCMIYSL